MCGATPSSAARVCWALTSLFLILCGFVLLLYGGIAPFHQNFSDLRADGVAIDKDVGLFSHCDSAADEVSRGDFAGGIGVINATTVTTIPAGVFQRQTPPDKLDNRTMGEISGYVRQRCERRKSPYLTLFVVTAIISLLAGLLGASLLCHALKSLKFLFPALAGASLALLVVSAMRMLDAYSHLSKYIDCSDLNPSSVDVLTGHLGAVCYDGMTSEQKPTISRILSQIIPFWVGLPLLFLTLMGLSIALSWLLKKGPHHAAHAHASSSYTAPYTSSAPYTRASAPPPGPASTGYGYGSGRYRA